MSQAGVSTQNFNVPNTLTAARLALSIVVFVLIPLNLYLPALFIFLLTASTDWVDGYWARKYGQVTQLGRIFDPFADKIAICGTFVFLCAESGSGIPAWMAVVVVGRELLVTALRSFLEQQGADFSASFAGKLKMVFQCAAVVASLLALHYARNDTVAETFWYGSASNLPQWLYLTLFVCVWLAVVSTVQSGVGYVFRAIDLMRR
jgi:CDP-diacylglycerol---glycerol-3-phosphate 3-phosphatidyltransferase